MQDSLREHAESLLTGIKAGCSVVLEGKYHWLNGSTNHCFCTAPTDGMTEPVHLENKLGTHVLDKFTHTRDC